ncbi:MAG TPA: hypothetical protein VNZ57_03120, partial [Longimicrobiales bacterium]|nr:hypothetical protein [Longimicrobiales bacterium]
AGADILRGVSSARSPMARWREDPDAIGPVLVGRGHPVVGLSRPRKAEPYPPSTDSREAGPA